VLRDHARESDRLSPGAAWTVPTRNASAKKPTRARHEIRQDADRRVDHEREKDRRFRADAAGERAEEERARDADELHEDEGLDLRF